MSERRLAGAALVLFDGTLWRDDEMVRRPRPQDRAAHGPYEHGGAEGTLAAFRDIEVGRKIFIHINNTNPILLERFARARRRREGRLGSGL